MRASTQQLIPAGSIQDAIGAENLGKYVVLCEDDPAIQKYVKVLHDRFFPPFTWIGEGIIVTADAGGLRKGDRVFRLGIRTDAEILELIRGVVSSENDHCVRNSAEGLLRDLDFLRAIGIAEKAPAPVTVERAGKEMGGSESADGRPGQGSSGC